MKRVFLASVIALGLLTALSACAPSANPPQITPPESPSPSPSPS
ncbi:MAG: hypothetical protein NW224_20635 [Leptolyngbyaceae cyanobacterium bins.302]|nr:hypothetical protein [Leptolyngbyaceae cyanobacterium bins.302]